MKKHLILLLFVSFTLVSCSSHVNETWNEIKTMKKITKYSDVSDLVICSEKNLHKISTDLLKKKMDKGGKFFLIDLREADEVANGVIEGSTNIPRGLIEFRIAKDIPGINPQDEIILYCKNNNRSILAANSLQQLGYSNVYYLDGGYNGFMGIKEEVAAPQVQVASQAPDQNKAKGAMPMKKKAPGGGGC
ncbi:MAG: hypothetical protein A2X64_03975 [Ignavibacteria bacterium GWF2_33_9]|nr:MAG: hypothetical protein A2X64_03975 [Ignavibacteria bacterium GWF2_33_9]